MNDNELVSFVLMHKANGTLPGELSRNDAERFQEAMRTVNLWLTTHTEQQGAALLAGAATDPARKVFHECTWRVATTGDMIRAKQDAGAWPPLTPEESALVLAYVTDLPHHGQPVSADDVAALRPFASERGVPRNRLYKWADELGKKGAAAFGGSGRPKASNDEVAVLKRELARLKEENEILKKAAAYFARELS